MKAADMATEACGSRDKRTTNAMPYPEGTPEHVEKFVKRFYAKAQFAATALAVFGTPVLAFGSVLAIEIASFLMTLVRKGIASSKIYHGVYSASLFIMFPAMFVTLHCADDLTVQSTFRAMVVAAVPTTLRMGRLEKPWSKYSSWAIGIPTGVLAAEVALQFVNPVFVAWLGALWSMGDTIQEFFLAKQTSKDKRSENPNEPPQKVE
eukprot:CAMPEP_0115303054 /NCGR_PEP_ID=MMETSP0270-20121206/70711_1 /TAXON_ID=71861 /ORGANISM="Scrippsiella trochoidea, Strain CCMP3099" /LENGTH=206 /DNA_ID=CAMNT_0002721021 /DNA_START=472 /DNA_END=1092 /DNA_ORIENTATION=+